MTSNKVIILNHEYADLSYERDRLAEHGLELLSGHCATEEEAMAATRDVAAIICIYVQLTERVLANMRECKVIARPGVGYDMIDVRAARAHGIEVTYVPDYGPDEVADHAVSLLMALKRKIVAHDRNVRAGEWNYKLVGPIYRLRTQTLGLVGFGRIGQRMAAKMREIIFDIQAYDPYLPDQVFADAGVRRVSLEDLFRTSDAISLHLPGGKDTTHLISAESIRIMERKPVIVNTSRGALVDTTALVEGLRSGAISGAGLDVLESEPQVPAELLELDNVIITPHAAWLAVENQDEVRTRAVDDLLRVLKGEKPRNPVP